LLAPLVASMKRLYLCAIVMAGAAFLATPARGQSETVIYSLPEGIGSGAPLMQTKGGTLYFVASAAGIGYGAVYRLSERDGAWQGRPVYEFSGNDGTYPHAELLEGSGSFYGVTAEGGRYGVGTVFSLTHAGGAWTESVVYSFTGALDGGNPSQALLWDSASKSFFGVTPNNDPNTPPHCGSIFNLWPDGSEQNLYLFQNGTDGCLPTTKLHELRSGSEFSLVGATRFGGTPNGYGTVYTLTKHGGRWREAVIHAFNDTDGAWPADLLVDKQGNIFGVASGGGSYDEGVVFELSKRGGQWQEQVLYDFTGAHGENPFGISQDAGTGTLYGTTGYGGANGRGTVYALRRSHGAWTQSVIYSFGSGTDAQYPYARPVYDPQANALYGTTFFGGAFNGGAVYAISLP
jgi:uncharacterized repeat protein (TIGR03803 family)